jgi:hypothetical protein
MDRIRSISSFLLGTLATVIGLWGLTFIASHTDARGVLAFFGRATVAQYFMLMASLLFLSLGAVLVRDSFTRDASE